MLKKLIIISALSFLPACTPWPVDGRGGQAESFETAKVFGSHLREENKRLIDCFDREIQAMSLGHAGVHHPARLVDLSTRWTRATRAHAAFLNREARYDLVRLSHEFHQFRTTLAIELSDEIDMQGQVVKRSCT